MRNTTSMTTSGSTVIRVFLSSTFVDFQEERSLLVKQVFPSLRRRARSRGVDIVDVDLRWGVTAEQTERGETLSLCLAEIDRCRPYFISLLGERYGWVPPADPIYYKPALLEHQPWLQERMGAASLTELEILHGVLRNPEMAGHAFFYLRDPAYAQAQSETGWVADHPAEQQRLNALKEEVRRSGFPVCEGLATPQAIAERIEADLWAVIEREHPEQEPLDPLQREAQRHNDYRRARTGLYLGGETAIAQLERWMEAGEQRILITGESGSGKSALIANWLEAHSKSAPQDLVHAHHLGCTNDASAVRPMLGRLIDSASQLLLAEQQIAEPLKVPQDWWELVAAVAGTLQMLGRWCVRQGRRWIWVLDGLDRLDADHQKALPWLPQNLPAGVQVVASALACPARDILRDRGYTTLMVEGLGAVEQEQLIQRYLSRYNKQLDGGLRQHILGHSLAASPLFLKVLLEELRQCGRFETLHSQLAFYMSATTVADLYTRVLERLENDGSGEAVRRVMTALWASRAGLTEQELLAITDLSPLQWAPVDLALEKAFGRNGNRLVFDHDYLRIAIQERYLPTEDQQRQAHRLQAAWYQDREGWDERDSEEMPWQLQQAGRLDDLRDWLLMPAILANMQWDRGSREVISFWLAVRDLGDRELDELIAEAVENVIEERKEDAADQIWFVDRIAELLDEAGLYRELLLRLRTLAVELEEAKEGRDEESMLSSLAWLASTQQDMGLYNQAEALYLRCLEARERLLGPEHPDTLTTVGNLGLLYSNKGDYEQAEAFYNRCLEARQRLLGPEHPDTLTTVGNLGGLYSDKGDYEQAEAFYNRCLEARQRLLGPEHPDTLIAVYNLAEVLSYQNRRAEAIPLRRRELAWCRQHDGDRDPSTLASINELAIDLRETGELQEAETLFRELVAGRQQVLEANDFDIGRALGGLSQSLKDADNLEEAATYALQALNHRLEHEGPDAWWTNRERLDLDLVLQKLGRDAEVLSLIDQLQDSLNSLEDPCDADRQLLAEADALLTSMGQGS